MRVLWEGTETSPCEGTEEEIPTSSSEILLQQREADGVTLTMNLDLDPGYFRTPASYKRFQVILKRVSHGSLWGKIME